MGTGAGAPARAPLLRVEGLAVSFPGRPAVAQGRAAGERALAVDGVSLTVYPGQTVAVVGESGCGKSVTAMSLLQLVPSPPARLEDGRAEFRLRGGGSVDLLRLRGKALRAVRGGQIAMIFQEPMTSLNPVYTVGEQIAEAVAIHTGVGAAEARGRAIAAMAEVGIPDAGARAGAYPHQFSGGMRQRVMIAMALACEPALLLADEPTTALDVTIQAQILGLLRGLQRGRGMAVMLITHALGVVAENADVVCVMYGGRVVEYARVGALFDRPMHPYTRGLLASIPRTRARVDRLVTVRDVVGDEGQFTRLGGGLRPWWPWHPTPAGTGDPDSALVELEPGHWVRLWRSEAVHACRESHPDLA
ncbi:MAG: peptide ABC transporter ATP-binding protein [Planctomyces sp.]|nr:peptide ABC transporter ATP-binding protein [Planctomyces sp.]